MKWAKGKADGQEDFRNGKNIFKCLHGNSPKIADKATKEINSQRNLKL